LLKKLSQKAREGQLTREEIQGGTFTISNLGMYGITSFTSIINPPQSAILSVGAIKRRPVVVDKEDSINVRPMMNLTLGADHRIVDGAVAAQFLVDLIDLLEHPDELIVI
jgi:pyruvate dehydrogenase E2 component (dihydrolipoamide acetyltransferase)